MIETLDRSSDRLSRRKLLFGAAVASAVGVGGIALGRSTAGSTVTRASSTHDEVVENASISTSADTPNDADFGFCTDMTAHHVQALVLCQRVLGRDTGDAVQAAAAEVLQNQAMEVGQMRAWLVDWGQSTAPPETVMLWMHGEDQLSMPLGMMPGYATASELQALSLAEGLDQGRMFLELMREHHLGGIEMADAASRLAAATKVRRLATAQAEVQTFEITQYEHLLATTYA